MSYNFFRRSVLCLFIMTGFIFSCGDDTEDKTIYDSQSSQQGYVRINAYDLTPGSRLVVRAFEDGTAVADMYGDNSAGKVIGEAVIQLDATYGEGSGYLCFMGTSTPISLEESYYASLGFIDSNLNGEPDTAELYVQKDFYVDFENQDISANISGISYDDPDFINNF